jgi:hypothetical protein
MTRAHRKSSVGRRLAVAVSTGAFTLVSLTGVGVAADRAVPGDFLYPLDRALERIGLTSDIVEERLLEAITLAERGDMVLAVQTANEALDELSRRGVTATLPAVTQELAAPTTESADEPATTTTEGQVVADTTTLPATTDTQAPGDTQASDEPQEPADAPETTVEAAEPVDAGATLRLAAEQLLQSVRSAKTDPSTSGGVTAAALFLAETTAGASSNEVSSDSTTSTTSSTTTSTTTSSTTTTTTVPDESAPANGNDENSGTTTTTVASDPDDGSGSDDPTGDGEDDSPGPIFLPTP